MIYLAAGALAIALYLAILARRFVNSFTLLSRSARRCIGVMVDHALLAQHEASKRGEKIGDVDAWLRDLSGGAS